MTAQEALVYLKKNFPDGKIVLIPENNPTEIICELGTHPNHLGSGVAIAAIKQSASHYHKVMTETYEVKLGNLQVQIDGNPKDLKPGDECVIKPGEIHSANGDFAIVKVTSTPPWTSDDHFLA